jgi:hypothetical protein
MTDLVFRTANGAGLSYDIIGSMVQTVMKDKEGRFLSHSLRITGACALMAAGLTATEIQIMGDWKSQTFLRYLRTYAMAAKGASELMGF